MGSGWKYIVTLSLALGVSSVMADETLQGSWQGAIRIMGQELGIAAHFTGEGSALAVTLDIPAQNAMGLPMQNVSYQHPNLHFEIPGAAVAVFEGTVEGERISGDYLQSGLKGTFELLKQSSAAITESADVVSAAEPLPYTEEEVEFTNGDIRLAGTLTLPEGAGPFPAAVMITGSGPQNRDEELFGFRPFRVIADHLARAGIATLRYDDRGVGGSTGNVSTATTADFATDVLAAIQLLHQRDEIDADRIGVIGHSEGGIIGPMVAESGDLAFVVILAGPSMSGAEILYDQGARVLKANGATAEELLQQRAIQEQLFAAIRSGEGWDLVKAIIASQVRASVDKLSPEQRAAIADVDAYVNTQVAAQVTAAQTPWFRFFIDYDPVPALEALQVPTLAVFGELDLQVPPDSNRPGMEQAFSRGGQENYTIVTLKSANHLFQQATTGSPAEYPTLEKAFVPELLPLVTDWIKGVL
ncbi:MAG TPA: alpha/beta fold hydrolase [Xanthomonadales bacterium]|nr:alpha/beta fold hydrolase [Xanthomonadales bacterium]